MTLTTHAAAGIVVSYWTGDPVLGFFAAAISHYILDIIPHGDEHIYWRLVHNLQDRLGRRMAIADTSTMTVVLAATLLFKTDPNNELIIWGAFGGILPDLIMTLQTQLQYGTLPTATGAKQRWVEMILRIIAPFQQFHKFAHDLIRTPIRLQEGYIIQGIFLAFYAFWFIR